MNQYTLDYSEPRPGRWRRTRQPHRRMTAAFRRTLLLLSGLVCGIAVVGVLRMRTEVKIHHERYQEQVIQYDSLLATKLEADRELEKLRIHLLKRQP